MKSYYKGSIPKILFMSIIIIVLIGIILNPKVSLNSAASGLTIWFNIVIPSLLPFLIISEILIQFGFVEFIGKLLEPLMKPVFNLSGKCAFPIAMSLISGYPVGVKLTSRLREKKSITRNEANRLITFTSTSGPLFMLGAISVGMLKDPNLAPLILIPHYLSVFILGILSSFLSSKNRRININTRQGFFSEIKNSYIHWVKTKQSIGTIISRSIKESMDTIILIGGLVIFYSVLVEILFNMKFVNELLIALQRKWSLDMNLLKGFLAGIFEITIGCKQVSLANIDLLKKLLIINFLIGWSGLSVHSQGFSFISRTDINGKIYLVSKFFHGVFSTILTYILYLLKYKNYIQPTFIESKSFASSIPITSWISLFFSSAKLALLVGIYIFLLSIVVSLIFKVLVRSS